ncbi:MAG TPA: flagellar basal body P-ring formation chaperone FlgA [Bryobacteraceae bacterium]|nr:flagellar basal body P-ring formation chaperone FlgA [Bryobacteraceae bacterium]
MIILAAALAAGCISVEGDRIRAADLAAAVPAFAALAPDAELGYTPAPGARRMLSPGEVARMAARHGIALETAPGLCIERAMEHLTEERVLAALRAAVGNPEARIELLDFSRYKVPRGELEFARSGYTPPPEGADVPVVWRGKLKYAGNRSMPVWARVRIGIPGKRLVAAEDLPAGLPIQASQVRVETTEMPLFAAAPTQSVEDVVGRVPKRTIRAGEAVPAGVLEAPLEVERGETVTVKVNSGAAQLSLKAKAVTPGRKGDLIMLRNPDNGRRFQGRVEGQGRVIVDAK